MSQTTSTSKPKPLSMLPKPAALGSLLNRSSSDSSRPSLLAGLTFPSHDKQHDIIDAIAPPRPRRLWKVNDTALRPVPFFYPPLNPRCTAFINDAPPSVVAVRIAECLRKRSVSVEYDEEAVTATAMTVDRCHFLINMFQGAPASVSPDGESKPDFSHGVIVECQKVRGDTMSFHRSCRAVLQAALSHSTGADDRKPYQSACQEFPRLAGFGGGKRRNGMHLVVSSSKKSRRTEAVDSLEHAFGLLKKDRLGPQKLGMQSLVTLTDAEASGSETALHCALAVLGAPNLGGGGEEPAFLRTLHYGWIVQLLQDRSWPGELKDEFSTMSTPHQQPVENVSGVLAGCKLSLLGEDCNARPSEQHKQEGAGASGQTTKPSWSGAAGVEEYHCGILRSLALRVLANSLDVVARRQSDMLKSILRVRCSHLVSDKFLSALVDDLAGAIRPPAVVEGTRLSSAHEAALAIRCLGVLAEHSDVTRKFLLSDDVLESLEKARAAGRSTHEVLAAEAERTYSRLTEDARSC